MSRPAPSPYWPLRDGVSASCVALPHSRDFSLLLDYLSQRFPRLTRAQWSARMDAGWVLDEQGQHLHAQSRFCPGARVAYYRCAPEEPLPTAAVHILYRDDHILVADKPHGIPVTPSGTYVQRSLLVQLKRLTGLQTLTPLHRIDRETAGLVLFGIQTHERAHYHALFRETGCVTKRYAAIAPYREDLPLPMAYQSHLREDENEFFKMRECRADEAVPPGSLARTRVLACERKGAWARYTLEPNTGKRHQLRVHMMSLGIPIVGDAFYPHTRLPAQASEDDIHAAPNLQLLAQSLQFLDPITRELRQFATGLTLQWP